MCSISLPAEENRMGREEGNQRRHGKSLKTLIKQCVSNLFPKIKISQVENLEKYN